MSGHMPSAKLRSGRVRITLNGDVREVPTGLTIAALLYELELDPRLIVVERNRKILRDREAFSEVELRDGDTLEVVHFVGGG